jgi:serine/threonine protein kinase
LSFLSIDDDSSKNDAGKEKSLIHVLIPSREGIDLLDQLLVYDHEKRLTAREAMMHPFFDDVRDLVTFEVQSRWAVENNLL